MWLGLEDSRLGPWPRRGRNEIEMLTAIKVFHTLIWAFLASSIVALPVVGMLRRFHWAAILTGLVLLECGVLAVGDAPCPTWLPGSPLTAPTTSISTCRVG